VPGPSPPPATGATATPPAGRQQSRSTAHHAGSGGAHGHGAGAGALGRGVLHAGATAAYALAGIAGLASGALSCLPRAGPRRLAPSRRAPLFTAPTPPASRTFSQFLLFTSVFEAGPVALGERLGGFSFAPAHFPAFFVYAGSTANPGDRGVLWAPGAGPGLGTSGPWLSVSVAYEHASLPDI